MRRGPRGDFPELRLSAMLNFVLPGSLEARAVQRGSAIRVWRCLGSFALGLVVACGEVSDERAARGAGGAGSAGTGPGGGVTAGGASSGGSASGSTTRRVCEPDEELADRCSQRSDCSCPLGDERPECRAFAQCESWPRLSVPKCDLGPGDRCPASMQAAQGTACFANGARCVFEDGKSCVCASQSDLLDGSRASCEAPAQWYCGCEVDGHLSGAGVIGEPCDYEGLHCGDSCFSKYARACENGVWIRAPLIGECV